MASLLSLVIGAALYGVITRFAIPPLAWVGLPLLLHSTRSLRPVPVTGSLWIALFVSLAVARRDTMPIAAAIYLPIMVVEAAIVVVAFVVDRAFAPRLTGLVATLVFPLALTAMEFLRSRITPAASWGSIAYSQYGVLPLMQVASVAGIWGVTFLLGWCTSVAELAWRSGLDWTPARGPAIACGAVLGVVLVVGSLRVTLAPTDDRVVRAATLNRPAGFFAPGEMTRISEGRIDAADRDRVHEKLSHLHEWFLEGSTREARAGARLIAWPEQNLLVLAEDEAAFLERARRTAVADRVYLAIGMGTIHIGDPHPLENKLVVFDPAGQTIVSHLKTRAVAGWEAGVMRRGTAPLPIVATPHGRVVGAICFEADFPELIRQSGRGAADALIVIVNDWPAIKEIHLRMHVFRAIENGVSLVRPAASGLSAVIDPWGRTIALTDHLAPGGGTMVADVPMRHVPTLYARWGDWLPWLSVVASIAVICAAAMR